MTLTLLGVHGCVFKQKKIHFTPDTYKSSARVQVQPYNHPNRKKKLFSIFAGLECTLKHHK